MREKVWGRVLDLLPASAVETTAFKAGLLQFDDKRRIPGLNPQACDVDDLSVLPQVPVVIHELLALAGSH
jgi:hypothetical protein